MLLLVNGVPRAVCAALAFAHERTGAYHGGCQRLPNFFARPKGLRCRAMALQHSSSGTAKHGMPHSRRHDIDGLRALAVLFVIAFHYAPTAVPGGFIGVSVFFAISGFLMGQILDTTHDVDLAVFYRRRAVRIVPATLVCITLSLLALFAIRVPPASLFDALEATAASLLSAANISYWWRASGYFAASDDSRRLLLHLWSLGVEEQFYLFLPLLMRFCASSFRVPVVGALLALTAVASYIVTQSHANAAYYLLVFRAPELLVGVLASMALSRGYRIATIIKRHHCMLHWASVAALVTVAMLFGEAMPFPSVTAMLPATLTAVALLAGAADDDNTIDDGDDRRVNVAKLLLSEPLLRWIGLVSFSLYLYHRPLLVIVRLLEWPQTNWLLCKLFCATLCLAYVSYRFVEEPARTKCASLSLRFLVLTRLALLIVVVALLSSYTVWTPYYTVRRQPQSNITTQNTTMMTAMSSDCQMDLGYLPDLKGFSVFCCPFFQFSKALLYFRLPFPLFFFAMCIPISLYASGQLPYVTSGDNMIIVADARMNTPPYSIPQSLRGYARLPSRVLLWGDSHAIHAVGLMEEVLGGAGSFFTAAMSSCAATGVLNMSSYPAATVEWLAKECPAFNSFVMERLVVEHEVIVLASNWILAFEHIWSGALPKLLSELHSRNKTVILLGQLVRFASRERSLARCNGLPPADANDVCNARPLLRSLADVALANARLQEMAASRAGVWYWDVNGVVCPLGVCEPYPPECTRLGVSCWLDATHLSFTGSSVFGRRLMRRFGPPQWVQSLRVGR